MNKELEYEVNNFANLLNKDCMNLMECLKKQGEDNKPILYLGKHYKKVILPYEEYQKMYKRLESIDNANPSEALECLERIGAEKLARGELIRNDDKVEPYLNTIEQALLKAQEPKQYVDELKLVEKKLNALEIIKEKRVNVGTFIHLTKILKKDYEKCKALNNTFGANICDTEKELLTEEEFNLLKGILNDEQ